jgi:hypothetical protein
VPGDDERVGQVDGGGRGVHPRILRPRPAACPAGA